MIRISILYPYSKDATFNFDYYCNNHLAMVKSDLGNALKKVQVEKGLVGNTAEEPPHYIAVGHLDFESIESFQASFAPHAAKHMADIANYTNIQPVFQASAIIL